MPKYDLEFKKKRIELFKEKKTLPSINIIKRVGSRKNEYWEVLNNGL